jgi:transglutaminase-like putative cysteine protease
VSAAETIGGRRLAWLIAAMAAATLPFALDLPPWLVVEIAAIAWWRVRGERRGHPTVPDRVRWIVLGLTAAALVLSGNFGFGLTLATPAFVAFVWIKLLELNSQRDYVLCCFIAYFLVAVLLFDQQSLPMCAYAVAVLGLISAALARFHAGREGGRVLRLVAAMGAQALPLAAVVFMFFPRLHLPMPSLGGQGISGFADQMRPGDLARIATSDRIAFRVMFPEGGMPPADQLYWRGLVMNESEDGASWRVYRFHTQALQPSRGDGPLVAQDITLMPNGQPWLFALENPQVFPEGSIARANRTVAVPQDLNHVLRYAMVSRLGSRPTDRDEISARPPRVTPPVLELARRLRVEGDDADQAAERVLGYFHEQGFTYSLEPGQMGGDALGSFLFERRAGFCAHYATAFCALMRLMRHPARVVVGYRGGEMNTFGNFLVVRQEHAHAWAEVLEPDGSWRRVDPTAGIPTAPGETIPAAQQAAAGLAAAPDRSPAWMPEWVRGPYRSFSQWSQYAEARWDSWFLGYDADHQAGLLKWLGIGRLSPARLLAAVAAAVLTLLAALALIARWRRGPRPDPASVVFSRFCARLQAIGLTRQPWEGPIDFTERAAAALPAHADLLRHAGWLYAQLRYGRPSDPRAALELLRQCIRRLPSRPQGRVRA